MVSYDHPLSLELTEEALSSLSSLSSPSAICSLYCYQSMTTLNPSNVTPSILIAVLIRCRNPLDLAAMIALTSPPLDSVLTSSSHTDLSHTCLQAFALLSTMLS